MAGKDIEKLRKEKEKKLNTSVDKLNIGYASQILLKKNNINTLGNIIETDIDKLKKILVKTYSDYDPFKTLSCVVHMYDLTLKDEFKDLNINDKIALTSISTLNIDDNIKNTLNRNGKVYILGELLKLSYNDIMKIKDMDRTSFIKLKKCLNKFGIKIKDEECVFDYIKEKIKDSNEILLEEVFSSEIYNIFYNNNIFTLEKLIKYQDEKKLESYFDILELEKINKYLNDYDESYDLFNIESIIKNDIQMIKLKKHRLVVYYDELIKKQENNLLEEKKRKYIKKNNKLW